MQDLQAGVGGDIEVVPGFSRYQGKPAVAFCNEEGKLNGLPVNERGTALWRVGGPRLHLDFLVGPIVIVTGDRELMEEL